MIDAKQFKHIQKQSSRSFNAQKALIKKVFAGREIKCESCHNILSLITPEQSDNPGIKCAKGCTDIALDFS